MPKVVLTTISSDSHTWNLVYLELYLNELGFDVANLGACTPVSEVIEAADSNNPDLIVVSSVNGHGYHEGQDLCKKLRANGWSGSIVIGGKLTTNGELTPMQRDALLAAGYNAVLGESDLNKLQDFVKPLSHAAL